MVCFCSGGSIVHEVVHEYIVIVLHDIATRVSERIIVGLNVMIANPVFEQKVVVEMKDITTKIS